jgi:hypothetical protein
MALVTAPTLEELKTRECTPAELQAALVKLIDMHNGTVADINKMIGDGRIRSKQEAFENIRYGL